MGILNFIKNRFEALAAPRSVPRKSAWERYIPMTKEEAINVLKRDLPSEAEVTITVNENGSGLIRIDGAGIDEARTFNFEKGVIYCGHMVVDYKNKGIGRHIMRNEIEFFAICGMKRFEIYAALSAGGYAWARLGFLPDSCEKIREEVRERFKDIKSLLNRRSRRTINSILEFKSPTDIWRLADYQLDLTVRLTKVFEKANCGHKNAKKACKKISTNNKTEEKEYKKTMIESFEKGAVQPLGRVLLAGTSWGGHIDFDNKQQMERVGQYVGGWHILKV